MKKALLNVAQGPMIILVVPMVQAGCLIDFSSSRI